jgi:HlyD family secretion protein
MLNEPLKNAHYLRACAKALQTNAGTLSGRGRSGSSCNGGGALTWAATRSTRRKVAVGHRHGPAGYFRPGDIFSGGRKPARRCRGNLKVRFYVPESALPRIAYGDEVKVGCDGCAANLKARISFIASAAEFTPPVIYSRDERSKLVFLVEALPEKPQEFRVGQPIEVAVADVRRQMPDDGRQRADDSLTNLLSVLFVRSFHLACEGSQR